MDNTGRLTGKRYAEPKETKPHVRDNTGIVLKEHNGGGHVVVRHLKLGKSFAITVCIEELQADVRYDFVEYFEGVETVCVEQYEGAKESGVVGISKYNFHVYFYIPVTIPLSTTMKMCFTCPKLFTTTAKW